jgi:hypothetical protein
MLRGFLLVELLVGLVIVALVMLGAAAIMDAVAEGWTDQDVTRSTQVQANQTYQRVQNALEGAKYVGYWNAGSVTGSSAQPGCIFFWQTDNFGGVEAGDPYAGEMAMIEYDSTTSTLWLYQCPAPAQMTGPEKTAAQVPLTYAQIGLSSTATWFAGQSFVQKQALGGPGTQANNSSRLDVQGFQVSVSSLGSTSQLPVIEFAIGFTRADGTTLTLYNTTTIRGPTTQPQ